MQHVCGHVGSTGRAVVLDTSCLSILAPIIDSITNSKLPSKPNMAAVLSNIHGVNPVINQLRVQVAGGCDMANSTTSWDTKAERDALLDYVNNTPLPDHPNAALHAAAANGDPNAAALAIRAGANIENRNAERRTPLLVAAYADHLAVANLLAEIGADPNAEGGCKDTPWLVTGVTGSVAMGHLILQGRHKPDMKKRNRYGGVSIIPASERGHVEYVRFAAEVGVDVNHVNDLHWTALLEAVILGDGSKKYVDIVQVLLEYGADPAIADKDGVTALQHAKKKGLKDIIDVLQDK
jgi:ankyrin repeat protein